MKRDLIKRRDAAADRHDLALERDPTRATAAFRTELQNVVSELEAVVRDGDTPTADPAELARALAWTGSAYFDLGRGVDVTCLQRSVDCYMKAERLLADVEAPLQRAKLDFNLANTLRGLSRGSDVGLLEAAQERYERAARAFSRLGEGSFAQQAQEYLDTLRSQLSLVRNSSQASSMLDQLRELQEQVSSGKLSPDAAHTRLTELRGKLSPARVNASLDQAVTDAKSGYDKHRERFADNANNPQQLDAAAQKLRDALAGGSPVPTTAGDSFEAKVMSMLGQRLAADQAAGKLTSERAGQLGNLLERLNGAFSQGDDLTSLAKSAAAMRGLADEAADFATNIHYGVELPSGSRQEQLAEHLSTLKRFLLPAAMRRSPKPLIELMERQSELERKLHSNERPSLALERDCWRLASDVHDLARSGQLTLANPVWPNRHVRNEPQSVFLSGGSLSGLLGAVASERDWTLLGEPRSGTYEIERWNQLRGSSAAVFHLPKLDDQDDEQGHSTAPLSLRQQRAQVCYDLGIALALGIPIVVAVPEDAAVPFDIPVQTLRLKGDGSDAVRLAAAIEHAVYSVMWGAAAELFEEPAVYQHAAKCFAADTLSGAQAIAWGMVKDSKDDPFAFTDNLKRFIDMALEGEDEAKVPQLLRPAWAPSAARPKRCFHVTAFRNWSEHTRAATRAACQRHGIAYRHGEDSDEQRIIEAIWSELTSSSCVLADLTDLNPNAALELGIAHSLGKEVRVLFNGSPKELFQSVLQTRIARYDERNLEQCIEQQIAQLATC